MLIGEPVELLSFFLVLKLSNNCTVELLHRTKAMKTILYDRVSHIVCSKEFFSFP
jgi:hypothetical protein